VGCLYKGGYYQLALQDMNDCIFCKIGGSHAKTYKKGTQTVKSKCRLFFNLLNSYLRSVFKRHTPIISAYGHEIHHTAPKSVVKFRYCSPLLFQGFHKYVYFFRLSLLLVYNVIDFLKPLMRCVLLLTYLKSP